MLKIGLAGTWHVHFRGYAMEAGSRDEDCVITRLWEPNEEVGEDIADTLECEYFTDYDAFLAGDGIDAVIVSSETSLHPEVIIKAAEAGKHIFTEKVLSFTLEDAKRIKEAVDKNGVKFCISFPWRGRGEFLWLKQALADKLVGDVTYIRMRNAHNGASGKWLTPAFFDPETCGGGAMMDLGAHPMYLLNWFMGKPKSVSSVFTNFMVDSVEDNAVSVLEYPCGAIGVSETSFVAENNPYSLEICGTKGTIFAGGPDNKLTYKIGKEWQEPEETPDATESPINIFIDALVKGTDIPYTIDDAVALTETMEAAFKSHRSGAKYYLD